MRRRIKKALAVLLACSIYIGTIDTNVFAKALAEEESTDMGMPVSGGDLDPGEFQDEVNSVSDGDIEQGKWDGITTEAVYEEGNYQVTFSLTGHWDGGYSGKIKVENTGDSSIQNWYLRFDFDNLISNIWNAEVQSQENGKCIVKNVGWNKDIAVGGSIEFGFSGNESFLGFPEMYDILPGDSEVSEEDYTITYHLSDDWGEGFEGSISITNHSDKCIEDWRLEFDFEREITKIWDAVIESNEDNHFVIKNNGYNSNIAPGQTITFGIRGEQGTIGNVPCEYELYSYEMDHIEYVELADGKIDREYLERAIYINLLLRGMPTDDVRLADDYDKDGLNLAQEYDYDTNPFLEDTDEDGLTDYEEIYSYRTNPIKYDSDDDGMGDGTEINCGLNPLNFDTDGNGIIDSKEIVSQDVRIDSVEKHSLQEVGTLTSVKMTGKGDFSQKIYARAIENNEAITDIDCLVGTAFDFVHEEDLTFENSRLTFEISDEILEKYALEDLSIAWYNEEENALELIDTTYDKENQSLSAEVEHYSIYMVASVSEYFYGIDWENEDSILMSGKADVVFVIDTTGSMEGEIENVKNNVDTFVSELEENNVDIRLGLVEYKDIFLNGTDTTKNYGWFKDVSSFKSQVSSLKVSGGGGDGPESAVDALYCARNMESRTGIKKYIILITDAKNKNGTSVDSSVTLADEIENLVAEDVAVSVVTTLYYSSIYESLVVETDGISADINQNFASALAPLISKMGEQVNNGCWIRLSNGSVVCLDKDPRLGDESVDTDGDGLPDLMELKGNYQIFTQNPYTNQLHEINTWSFYSNPTKQDTDGDSLSDLRDLRPKTYDAVPVEVNNSYVKFSSGREWRKITCTVDDLVNCWNAFRGGVHIETPSIEVGELDTIIRNIAYNGGQDFTVEELVCIGMYDGDGSRLYMNQSPEAIRELVFRIIAGRPSRYYKYTGVVYDTTWTEVPEGTESGFFKGIVFSEADLNFSMKIYNFCDVYMVAGLLAEAAVVGLVIVFTLETSVVATANVLALKYYVQTFGVQQGIQMYKYLGVESLPDGVISWLQMDMADGDSSLDDVGTVVEESSKALVKEGLGKISGKEFTVTQTGIDNLKKYLAEQGVINEYKNQAMIARLESALSSGTKITGPDAVFYALKLKEFTLVSAGTDPINAYKIALGYYELSPYSMYAPEVVKMDPSLCNEGYYKFWEIEGGSGSNEIKKIYNSIKEAPNYPEGFEALKNGTTKNPVKNGELLDKLREIESGSWKKIYKDGYDAYGNEVSIHYFQSESGKVFDVKVKSGWSN